MLVTLTTTATASLLAGIVAEASVADAFWSKGSVGGGEADDPADAWAANRAGGLKRAPATLKFKARSVAGASTDRPTEPPLESAALGAPAPFGEDATTAGFACDEDVDESAEPPSA